MAAAAQPSIAMQVACNYQQIGTEMFVVMNIGNQVHATTLILTIDAAKAFSRQIKETAETAEVQVLKPVSALA